MSIKPRSKPHPSHSFMGRKRYDHPNRGRTRKREIREDTELNNDPYDHHDHHDHSLEYSTEERNSESDEEYQQQQNLRRYRRVRSYRTPGDPGHRFCCCLTRRRVKMLRDAMRDIVIIFTLVLLILSTLNESQTRSILVAYQRASNFTKSLHNRYKTSSGLSV